MRKICRFSLERNRTDGVLFKIFNFFFLFSSGHGTETIPLLLYTEREFTRFRFLGFLRFSVSFKERHLTTCCNHMLERLPTVRDVTIHITFGFNRTTLRATQTKLHSMFCAVFLKIALSATELMSFGHIGAAIWHRWTIICRMPLKISVSPTSQRQLTL